jgi:hypothetical protein
LLLLRSNHLLRSRHSRKNTTIAIGNTPNGRSAEPFLEAVARATLVEEGDSVGQTRVQSPIANVVVGDQRLGSSSSLV